MCKDSAMKRELADGTLHASLKPRPESPCSAETAFGIALLPGDSGLSPLRNAPNLSGPHPKKHLFRICFQEKVLSDFL